MKNNFRKKDILNIMKKANINGEELVQECLEKFFKINYSLENTVELLNNKHPKLFNRFIEKGSPEDNRSRMQETLAQHKQQIRNLDNFRKISDYLADTKKIKEDVVDELNTFLESKKYLIEQRIKTVESLAQNIKKTNPYTLTDIIGFRIVPKFNSDFVELINEIESKLEDIVFKINILSYSRQEAIDNIGPNSVHYKGIHYHLNRKPYMVEIQTRGKYTDFWAKLAHIGMYKPLVKLSKREVKSLIDFGRIANTVDFYEFLNEE